MPIESGAEDVEVGIDNVPGKGYEPILATSVVYRRSPLSLIAWADSRMMIVSGESTARVHRPRGPLGGMSIVPCLLHIFSLTYLFFQL